MPFSSSEPPVLISNQYVFSEMKPAFNLVKILVQEVGSSNCVSRATFSEWGRESMVHVSQNGGGLDTSLSKCAEVVKKEFAPVVKSSLMFQCGHQSVTLYRRGSQLPGCEGRFI